MGSSDPDAIGATKQDMLSHLYFCHCCLVHETIIQTFSQVVLDFRGNHRLHNRVVPQKGYEISAVIYEAGFERFPTLVFQDLDNNLTGTSNPGTIDYARPAFNELQKTVNQIKERGIACKASTSGLSTTTVEEEPLGTIITWNHQCGINLEPSVTTNRLNLGSMTNVISVMTLLLFTKPSTILAMELTSIKLSAPAMMLVNNEEVTERPAYERFIASFSIDKKRFRSPQSDLGPDAARFLSNSLIRRNAALHGGKSLARIGRPHTFSEGFAGSTTSAMQSEIQYLEQIRKHQRLLEEMRRKMKAWIIEKKGVMIQCKLYVLSVMSFCVLLVAGGITVGATVGNRIQGVDPFNITTYAWVFAAFVVLVAKSVRVHE
ncbi:hypothetical protein QBC38DRAFT_447846 [Podospora fimiseda]|uniref:Uncharacterized protein n=1 Tax=Podospora fimiseda TaxID=252190 RepID=A0AAN6YP74_9PEZI|nr:hypothetical protein QBC38DRAFT_447846 [Podospora fimiseda]